MKILNGREISSCLICPHSEKKYCFPFGIVIHWPASGPIPRGCRLKNAKKRGGEEE